MEAADRLAAEGRKKLQPALPLGAPPPRPSSLPTVRVTGIGYPECVHTQCSSQPGAGPSRWVTFNYSRGLLSSIPGYASSISYRANGLFSEIERANGIKDHQDVANGMSRPSKLWIELSNGDEASLGPHHYDGMGNLTRRASGVDGERYLYDSVGRLVSHETIDSGNQQGYAFDQFGNLRLVTGDNSRNWAIDTASNRLSLASYDSVGNLTAWGGSSYEYDPLGKMTHRNFPEETHIYTASDERLFTLRYDAAMDTLCAASHKAQLIRRIYEADPLLCACGQKMRVLWFLSDPPVVDKILKHVELNASGSQRGPPPDAEEQQLAS